MSNHSRSIIRVRWSLSFAPRPNRNQSALEDPQAKPSQRRRRFAVNLRSIKHQWCTNQTIHRVFFSLLHSRVFHAWLAFFSLLLLRPGKLFHRVKLSDARSLFLCRKHSPAPPESHSRRWFIKRQSFSLELQPFHLSTFCAAKDEVSAFFSSMLAGSFADGGRFFFQDSLSAVWVRPNLGKGF